MEFFLKHQTVIFRSLGAFLLVLGVVIYFWAAPQPTLSEAEKAAANVARMEKAVAGGSVGSVKKTSKSAHTQITQALRETRKKQLRMLMLMTMVLGAGFLGYSFLKKVKK